MQRLLGTWEGFGQAAYPTIKSANYREVLKIVDHPDKPILQIEQKTWRIHEDKSESLLHWEFGFVMPKEDTGYTWTNCQNNGRVEVMQGTLIEADGSLIFDFQTEVFGNDPRMIGATRRVEVVGDELRYTLAMAIHAHRGLQMHLQATLQRSKV